MELDDETTTKCENGIFKQVQKKPRKEITILTAKQLQETEFPETEWVVSNLIPRGAVMIVSAKSKIGKSFLVLQMGIAIANGDKFLGMETARAAVLYLDLEENEIMLQGRLERQLAGKQAPNNLLVVNDFSTMNDTFVEDVSTVLEKRKDIALIIVDVYQKIKKSKPANKTDYEDVYENFTPLKEIAQKYHCSIILVTHDRKMMDETDPFSNILGSTAIMGASDGAIAIYKKKRSDADATMSIIGRQVAQEDYAIQFDKDSLTWRMLGSSEEIIEQRAREEYERNPLVRIIRKLVSQNHGTYSGTIKEILGAAKYSGVTISYNERKAGSELDKLTEKFQYYDAIEVTRTSNGNAGYRRTFTKIFND